MHLGRLQVAIKKLFTTDMEAIDLLVKKIVG